MAGAENRSTLSSLGDHAATRMTPSPARCRPIRPQPPREHKHPFDLHPWATQASSLKELPPLMEEMGAGWGGTDAVPL